MRGAPGLGNIAPEQSDILRDRREHRAYASFGQAAFGRRRLTQHYERGEEKKEFGELLRYTASGFSGGLLLAAGLDYLELQRSAIGQWIVRTLSGEGESLLEGAFAIRKRLTGSMGSLAEAYGWGKLAGTAAPWLIDLTARAAGLDPYGIETFFIPYFYAMSDQIGANVSGLIFLRREHPGWARVIHAYVRHPVMLASLVVVLVVPVGLLCARLFGFSPTTQVRTAAETIAANLCWVPPLVGWLRERHEIGGSKPSTGAPGGIG